MTTPAEPRNPASISVVIPTFNDVVRLGDALASIVGQTLLPTEILVADDGSDDGTERFVLDFGARHAGEVPVHYLQLSAHRGAWAARNEAIARARGEWIANCDSDDTWAPTKLARQMSFIRDWRGHGRIALLGTYGYNMNDAKRVLSHAVMGPTSERDYEAIRRAGGIFYVIHSSALFLRSDFEAVGGYTNEYGAADDYPFFCRMAERGVVLNMPEPLVYYRKRAGSVQIGQFWDLRREVQRLAVNERRRAACQTPIGREEFAAQLAAAPAWERFKRRKQLWGFYFYRAGATNLANGRRSAGAAQLMLASLADWRRLRAGLANALWTRLRGAAARRRGSLPQTTDTAS